LRGERTRQLTVGVTVLVGWVPGEDLAGLRPPWRRRAAAVELPRPLLVDPPTLLRTRGPARGSRRWWDVRRPRYADLDPTPFAAVSLVFMFGMMFGDAGHAAARRARARLDWSWCSTLFGRSAPAKSRFPGSVYGSLPIHTRTSSPQHDPDDAERLVDQEPDHASRRQIGSGHHAVVTATNPGLRADADIPVVAAFP